MYLGIDVGGTKIQGAYLQGKTVILTSKVATPTSGYQAFLTALLRVVEETIQVNGKVRRIGVGVPGTVTKQSVTWVPNLPFLNSKDLAADLSERVGADVVVSNDAQLALLGEIWRGAAQHRQSAVLISIGTGVGGAIMMGGKIVRGIHGSAGAFGWLNLDWCEPSDPNHGYVERHASGSALEAIGQQLDPPLTSYEIISRARTGDLVAIDIINRFSKQLGSACASIASILDPEVLIFSGGLADAFDLFAEKLREWLREAGSPSVRETPLIVAQLGKSAAAYGALRAAMLQKQMWIE
ncbi:MAG TPA: ROK family protein [Ktedonobacteraceae bacterium]|nr:ROK family protein [Ktedonobacteraceae bacterium]